MNLEDLLGLIKRIALKYNIDKSQIPILWVIAKGALVASMGDDTLAA